MGDHAKHDAVLERSAARTDTLIDRINARIQETLADLRRKPPTRGLEDAFEHTEEDPKKRER